MPTDRRIRRAPPLGQVFLQDRGIENRILEALQLSKADAVLEIGAGPGNMTALLAQHAATLIAVELDSGLAAGLRKRFAADENVQIWEQDILQVDLPRAAQCAGRQRIKVFGNLPYYITSPCLMHLFKASQCISTIVVMVQLEVARRMAAQPGTSDYGLLSVTCRYYSQPELLFPVPPEAFRPHPQVHSAVVRMAIAPKRQALHLEDEVSFWKWMRAAFAQKRKTLANNWKALCDPARLRATMQSMAIDPRSRAEALSLQQLAALYQASRAAGSPEGSGLLPTETELQ